MTIRVDFSGLEAAARKMGAEPVKFSLSGERTALERIDIELEAGLEIPDLSDVGTGTGLLSYKGRQILLYIPDHGSRVSDVLELPENGNKFHVADCSKLKEMRNFGRFDRYVVTNDLSGVFPIYGQDRFTRKGIEGEAALRVCKLCLRHLNYRGYRAGGRRYEIFQSFTIEGFFKDFSSFFRYLPRNRAQRESASSGYVDGWKKISENLRNKAGYRCQNCAVKLDQRPDLLHVHHINGVKTDNSYSNLKALCVACHKLEPMHQHLFVPHEHQKIITRLRKEQHLVDSPNWSEVFELADTGLHGVLHICRRFGAAIPEVGQDVMNSNDEVAGTLDLAWPVVGVGIAISESDRGAASDADWEVWSMGEIMEDEDGFLNSVRGQGGF